VTRKPLAVAVTTAVVAGLLAVAAPGASAAPDKATRAEQAVRHAHDQVALDDSDGLAARDVITDADGTTHVRFDRTRGGLPVLGGDMVVHQASDGALRGVSATTRKELRLSLTPSVTREQAIETARAAADNGATGIQSAVLEIDSRDESPQLVWAVVVLGQQKDETPSELLTLVDAQKNRVVDTHEQVEQADGTGHTLYSGDVTLSTTPASGGGFTLTDTRGQGLQRTTDLHGATTGNGSTLVNAVNTWGSGAGSYNDPQSAAADAHFGAAATWDYYASNFGRLGIANDGKGALSRVHYGTNYDNAFWQDSCFCMTYGDGDGSTDHSLVSLDVAGHEMSHGVTSRTAALKYSGESGGLNEATSDIFGTMVEFAAGTSDVGDYKIGEAFTNNKPFRWMYHPSIDKASPDCYSKTLGRLNVHYSSGVANRFFFLLAQGTTSPLGDGLKGCGGAPDVALGGVGRAAAAQIWYRALTTYMTSRSGYADAKLATQNAARDLAGKTVTLGTTSTPVPATALDTVTAAWRSVGVL
jgi:Zn-dependent metalloprotease